MKFHHMMSFIKDGTGGNPAGVVRHADNMTEAEMQEVAAQAGYPETAFICTSTIATLRVLFFTPTQPVDLCGHATIALLSLLQEEGRLPIGHHSIETLAGTLPIEVRNDGTVFYSQMLPTFLDEIVEKRDIAQVLGVSLEVIDAKPQIVRTVSTDMRDMIVPIASVKALGSIKPDMQKIATSSKLHDVAGMHLYALDDSDDKPVIVCRNFSPAVGIPEEAATGTLCGVTACALKREKKVAQDTMIFHQGEAVGSPSEILVTVKMHDSRVCEVWVGGRARQRG